MFGCSAYLGASNQSAFGAWGYDFYIRIIRCISIHYPPLPSFQNGAPFVQSKDDNCWPKRRSKCDKFSSKSHAKRETDQRYKFK